MRLACRGSAWIIALRLLYHKLNKTDLWKTNFYKVMGKTIGPWAAFGIILGWPFTIALPGICRRTDIFSSHQSLKSNNLNHDRFMMNTAFCDTNRVKYNLPLAVLSSKDAYDLFSWIYVIWKAQPPNSRMRQNSEICMVFIFKFRGSRKYWFIFYEKFVPWYKYNADSRVVV